MDRNTKINAFWSRTTDKNKNVNKIQTKVIKHFQPTMKLHVNDAELPCVGVVQDDSYKPFNVTETCPTRVRTTNCKTKPRVISKQPSSNFHHSFSKRSKLRRCIKKSSKSGNPNEFDSTSYMNELKNEINQFKAFQASLTKTADALKSEIKEFRNSTNTNSTNDVTRNYINLAFKNNWISDDISSSSCKKLHLSSSFMHDNKDKPSSTSEQSSSSSLTNQKSSVLKIIPSTSDREDVKPDNLICDKRQLPETLNLNDFVDDLSLISKPGPSSVSFFKRPQISASARPPSIPNFSYSKPSQQKLVKSDRMKKSVSGTNSKCLQTDVDARIQKNEVLQITTKTRLSKYQLNVVGDNGSVVKRNTDCKIANKGKDVFSGPAATSPASCESFLVTDTREEKSSCRVCTERNDDYVEILEQQKNQMKVFSDVIDKAQNVIALMNGNLKPRSPSTPVVEKVYEVYNVSTQADAFSSKKDAKQNTDSVQRDDKETNTAVSNEPPLKQDEAVQVKNTQENKLIGTTRAQRVSQKKLSTHLLPSVAITRELVTQKIPSINITTTDSARADNPNLGYEIVKHDSDDQLKKMISIIRTRRRKDHESQMTDKASAVEESIINNNESGNKPKQTESESKNPDHTAQLMWKSYQIYKHHKVPRELSLPEIDSATLSLIDDDVYKTYVNPNGKRSNANSKSTKVDSGNTNDDQDKPSTSISSSSLNLDNNSKKSIASILTHNRESLNEYNNTQLLDKTRDTDSHLYSSPRVWNRNNLGFEKERRLSNAGRFGRDNPDISNAVSANTKGYMEYPRRKLSAEEEQTVDNKVSKLSKASDRDFSNSTEQMIFSIDKVDIRRKSEFYENQGRKYSLYDMMESSTSRKKYNPKMRALHKIKSDFRNYNSSDEVIVKHDVKVQRASENSVHSTNSKESSGTHNTDESIQITHRTDSIEEIVYCSYCSKFCFGRNRHVHDDAYVLSTNRSSIQYSHNTESVKTEKFEKIGEPRKVENELNSFLDRKNNLNEDHLISNGKTEISDLQEQKSKSSKDEILDGSVERRHSVTIETAQRQNSTMETFIRGLTSSSAQAISNSRAVNRAKEDVIGFIKKSSADFQQNNKKVSTVMNVTIDESTITNSEVVNGGGGDKVLSQSLENGAMEEFSNPNYLQSKRKQEDADLNKIIFQHKTQNRINRRDMIDECEQSDGEILNKCDCSIGEIRLSTTYPESDFLRDLYNTNKMVVDRNVHNSNWISYFVKPYSGHKMYAPVPVNDSSDSFS